MKNLFKTSGFALIEVLISAFVVGVGFLALTSLQGNLTGSQRENKTHTEAVALANAKIEELKGQVDRSGFDALTSSQDSVSGKTENFTRIWKIDPLNYRTEVTVSVCWLGCSDDQKITVKSYIAYDSLKSSMLSSKNPSSPSSGVDSSVNANSSDDIRDVIRLSTAQTVGTTFTDNGKTYIVDGVPGTTSQRAVLALSCDGLNNFENNLKTKRINYDGVEGNEAIELYRVIAANNTEYCTPELRYNGGVIIPIRGIVHSGATPKNNSNDYLNVELFSFNASETGAYCYFKPETGATSAPYVCYVGGNCTGVTDTAAMDDADVTKCPVGAYSAAKVGLGGWRGKVGLRGVAGDSTYYNVCFQEEISNSPETLDSARNYYVRRESNNEGINKLYSCHDFLIVNGQSNKSNVHKECSAKAGNIAGISLASKTIQRDIAADSKNIFDPAIDTSFCRTTVYNIVGSIADTKGGTAENVNVVYGATTISCSGPVTETQYTCNNITTSADSLRIIGTYSKQTVECKISPPSNAGCTLTFSPGAPQYVVTGSISGTATAIKLNVEDGSITTPCVIEGASYTCNFQTNSTSGVVINASTTQTGYSVTPATDDLGPLNGQTGVIEGESFSVSVVPSYTVNGSISLGDNVDNITNMAVSIVNGSCTLTPPNGGWKKNTNGSYSCNAYSGSSAMTFAISPNCSDTKSGKKQYLMTSGNISSSGTGQLVVSFGDNGLGSSITGQNLSVTESGTDCGSAATSSN